MARHVLVPFEVPSDISSLFDDYKASADSKCPDSFWVLVRALKAFVHTQGRGYLPLSGGIPDMHSDTKRCHTIPFLPPSSIPALMSCMHPRQPHTSILILNPKP